LIFDDLREIQRQFGYLPTEPLRALAQKIDVPLYQLHGVASFYPHFRLTPPQRAALLGLDTQALVKMGVHPLVAFLANMQVERQRKS